MTEDYQFDDVDSAGSSAEPSSEENTGGGNNNNNGYASELFSKQIKAKFRTFFVDLKESTNGKFIKISEKSHGRKSTIMMDAEDIPVFIEALQEVKGKL
jgi:N-acetylglutamate synthase/N-acetylornithine aminotransferase